MRTLRTFLLGALAVGAAATAVMAHHSFGMFDSSKEIVIVGDVVRWVFVNPHSAIIIKDTKGAVWSFEGAAPPSLVGRKPKITGLSFKPGDRITMIYCPLHDGRPGGAIGLMVAADGTWYNGADGGCRPVEANWRQWLAAGYTSRAQGEATQTKK